jgi:ubiquinone/menaquinone biosynthesis C-methylase UbiE
MPDKRGIYSDHAEEYERLVSREDYQGNIAREIQRIVSVPGKTVVELGAGTGRLTRLFSATAQRVWAFDAARSMLQVAARIGQGPRLDLAVADHRALPLPGGVADIVISGWSIAYLVVWNPGNWRTELDKGLDEMRRLVRSGGTVVILETLGTGAETPNPPDNLVGYYAVLEKQGFQSSWIRTDYRFASLEEAERLVRFFFGDSLADRVVEERLMVLPECTGIWWLNL